MKTKLFSVMTLVAAMLVGCNSNSEKQDQCNSDCESTSKTECSNQCSAQCTKATSCCSSKANATLAENQVNVVYFHGTRRCVTCKAVESVAEETAMANGAIFQSVNRENEEAKKLVEQFKISGQTLLIVKNNEVVNLTNVAFMNAKTKPEVLKEKLATTIEAML